MTPEIEEAYRQADEAILGFLKLLLGLDQVTWAGSAAAPMPLDVAKFMAGLGLKVYDVYGMTETCGAVTANGPGGVQARHRRPRQPGHGGQARRGRRDPGPRPGEHPRLPPPGGRHPRPHRRGRLGAHRRHRHPRRRRLLRGRRPQEGADHHLGGQEHRAVEHRELPQGVPAHRPRDGDRRRPAVRRRDPHPRRRDRAAGGPAAGHRVHRPRRPRREAGDPGDRAAGRRRRQRAALAARAGQVVRAARRSSGPPSPRSSPRRSSSSAGS